MSTVCFHYSIKGKLRIIVVSPMNEAVVY